MIEISKRFSDIVLIKGTEDYDFTVLRNAFGGHRCFT